MQKPELKHTDLNVRERNTLTLNGVINVESFDENYLSLALSDGRVCIEGKDLKIESLTKENGDMQVSGKIEGVFYTEGRLGKRKFGKLLG